MSQRFRFVVGLGLFGGLLGCTVGKDFPRLVDIPDAPAQASPMEEKRKTAQEMVDQAARAEDGESGAEGGETAENAEPADKTP
ncbi:MAG: hypothetical protein EP347_04270 [Alphaproteobacteria bacterium]|nr:MAG: hypothetical protein EP347_04270 [Alphaproteobacteria bacterium]